MRTFMICTMAAALLAPQACVGDSPAGGGGGGDGDGGDTVTLPDGGSGAPDALQGGGEAGGLTLESPGLEVVRGTRAAT